MTLSYAIQEENNLLLSAHYSGFYNLTDLLMSLDLC